MDITQLPGYWKPGRESEDLVFTIAEKFGFTAAGVYKLMKVARTIADLQGKNSVETVHIGEAASYCRPFSQRQREENKETIGEKKDGKNEKK